jgi:GDP-L-fucose synthase
VNLWGSGTPLREFLWSEDMADACVYVMERVDFVSCYPAGSKEIRNAHLNIGTGLEISIRDLSALIARTVGYGGDIRFDHTKPDGTLRKLTDPTKLHRLGWHHRMEVEQGVAELYRWYLGN